FYMYGKGQNPGSLLEQLNAALRNNEDVFNMSGGEQLRDILPVEKVANYIVAAAMQKKLTGIINCSGNNPVSVKEFVLDYIKRSGKPIRLNLGHYPYPDYEPMAFWGINNKIKTIIENE
ncbi:MAG: NAD-dependent epimerase/dehydratase family protein, partial [Chitinophagaceae bacterium]